MNWNYSGQIQVIPFYTMKRQEENEEQHNPKKKTKTYEDTLIEEPKQLTFYQPPTIPLPFPYGSVGADNRHNAPPEQSCFICQNSFKPTDRALFTQGRLIHDTCFYCDTCNLSLQGINHTFYGTKIYCEPDYNVAVKAAIISSLDTRMLASPTKTTIEPNILSLMSQPASYQIANYNLHPTPVVNFDVTLPSNGTVTAVLVDGSNHTELPSGFQTGQTRQVEAGTKVVYFTGLKLSKMGKIKNDLEYAKVPQPDSYYIKFVLGNKSVNSTTFKIVSSTTMLPKDVRESVRPKKGGKDDKKS